MSTFGRPGPNIMGATSVSAGRAAMTSAIDTTNNMFHGYESYRMPKIRGTGQNWHDGGMPWNVQMDNGVTVPTYQAGVDMSSAANINTGINNDLMNEANEMNLYTANSYDQPFGPGDLEWLYRQQDVDGFSLSSRLDVGPDQLPQSVRRPPPPPPLRTRYLGPEHLLLAHRQPGRRLPQQ